MLRIFHRWSQPPIIPACLAAIMLLLPKAQGQERADGLTAKLREVCNKHQVPALAAAVVNTSGLIEAACYGERKRGSNDPVEISDRFPLASNTKSMTGTLAAALVEAGKIDWTTTVGEVWPKATKKDIHPKLRDVTLDELLSHQSGLAADIEGRAWGTFFQETSSPPLARRRMIKLALPQRPATRRGRYAYSNLGYVVAGAMLETRAKVPFEQLMQEYLFEPLEMESARFHSLQHPSSSPLVWGHKANGDPADPRTPGTENPTAYAPVGTVWLTIEDYAKYARWHLGGEPSPVLKTQQAFDHLHEPLVNRDAAGTKYACGWVTFSSGFGPALQHAGSNTNGFALIWVLPESNVAAVACTNTGEPQAFTACDEVIGHLLISQRSSP